MDFQPSKSDYKTSMTSTYIQIGIDKIIDHFAILILKNFTFVFFLNIFKFK